MIQRISSEISALRQALPAPVGFNHNTFLYSPIENFTEDSIYNIILSIIKGEYIINDIRAYHLTIIREIDALEIDFPYLLKLKDYLDVVRECLDKYLNFHDEIEQIYGIKIRDYQSYTKSKNKRYYTFIRLLDLTTRLNNVDNNFSSRDITLKILFNIKNELAVLSFFSRFSEIHNSLEVKVNYLIYKWYLRTAQKEDNIEYTRILNNQRRTLPPGIFDQWINKMLNHYEIPGQNWITYFYLINQNSPYVSANVLNISNNLDSLSIHNNIKYYKDVLHDDDKLKQIVNDLETRIGQLNNSSELEKTSYYLLLNYAINNYFSSFCEKQYKKFILLKESGERKVIEKSRNIINKLVNKYDLLSKKLKGKTNNFFLDYKVSFYCIKILNEAYELCVNKNDFILEFNEDVNSKINFILDNYKGKKKWSLLNNNYIFKLDYNQSILNHSNLNVYYASSFTLAKVDDDIENRFEVVYNLYRELRLRFTLKYEIETIHNLNEEFKKDNKRIIEVVTVFTAIISFIVGSIGAYSFLKTFEQALIFMLCFGTAISIFVLLMYLANSKLNKATGVAEKRDFNISYKGNPLITINYPLLNYKLLRNTITLFIAYLCLFSIIYFLFKDYKKDIAIAEQKKGDSIKTIEKAPSISNSLPNLNNLRQNTLPSNKVATTNSKSQKKP
ncbi:hypothetical protein LXM63_19695 [Chryseobacterium gleum]|uniref:hypothetical protein n=1 Tax=Chryseobacterium gleum TaxID=250 RepID=UPI001E487986|nr:hypothetical protein [Chryseobacterium gleum]MCE4067321.1 hypothetical protein [Chryseobacterium gleum]